MFKINSSKLCNLFLILSACSSFTNAQSILIQNVTIVDVTGAETRVQRNVLIADGRIERILAAGEFETSDDTVIIDATNQFLIPGLWDMHTHWRDVEYLPLFIVNGITGIREMDGLDRQYAWREAENTKDYIGPKVIIGSALLDGSPPTRPSHLEVKNEQDARARVNEYYDKGADFIKVYENLSREAYFAIADESKKLGIAFAGHVPRSITIAEASDAGQKSIEHLNNFGIATSDTHDEIAADYIGREMNDETRMEFQQRLFAGHRGDRASQLYEKLASNGTWLSPTLTVLKYISYMDELAESYNNTQALLYLPSEYAEHRISEAEDVRENRTDAQQELANRQFEFYLRVVGDMHKAGVKIIAGTDASAFCFPGCTIHNELELLVEAGLSPLAALQAATINAAEFSGRLDELGTVEEGKIADLVLLEADPLTDIRNTSRISAVVLNGAFYDKFALEAMLTEVRILPANYRP